MKPVLRLRLHATQSQTCFPTISNALALLDGNGIFTATPTERITHYTLQAKSCAQRGHRYTAVFLLSILKANISNEFYSRDIAKKVKSGKHIRALEGKFMGTTAPFGYRKDLQDKNHLIIDEATAPTVRLIYSLALEGYGKNRIGRVLYERKIPKLSYYKQEFFSRYEVEGDDWYDWKQEVVTRLLRTPVYKGGMYVHVTSKPTFKCKGRRYIKRSNREVLEDVHEAIVTKEVCQTVQDIIDRHTKVKPCSSGYDNIFRGLLKCPDCGQTLLVHTDNRNPDRDLLDKTYYQCTTYRKKGANFCTAHRISVGDIESAIACIIPRKGEVQRRTQRKCQTYTEKSSKYLITVCSKCRLTFCYQNDNIFIYSNRRIRYGR